MQMFQSKSAKNLSLVNRRGVTTEWMCRLI